jgi:hypothetical protein
MLLIVLAEAATTGLLLFFVGDHKNLKVNA